MVVYDFSFLVDILFSELEVHQPHLLPFFEEVGVDLFAVIFNVFPVFGFNFVEIEMRCFEVTISVFLSYGVDFVIEFDPIIEIIDEVLGAVGLVQELRIFRCLGQHWILLTAVHN